MTLVILEKMLTMCSLQFVVSDQEQYNYTKPYLPIDKNQILSTVFGGSYPIYTDSHFLVARIAGVSVEFLLPPLKVFHGKVHEVISGLLSVLFFAIF